jgi:phosphatidylglycerol:prolipoprotein diacylglycerol transferase
LSVDPVAFSLFGFEIRWYGIITALSLIIGFTVAYFITGYRGQRKEEILNFAPFAIVFSVIGARLLHVAANWSYYAKYPLYIFAFRRGGLAIQGVILGGVLALIVFCRIRKLDFWLWADIAATGLILGQAIGRWGNFFNQEAYGKPISLHWKFFYIDYANRLPDYKSYEYFHPTFLYESVANLLLFGFLMLMHRYYKKRPGKIPYGLILAMYLGIYSIYRTFIEYYRVDSSYWGPVKVVYVIDFVVLIAAFIIANHVIKRFKEKKQLEENINE